MTSKDLTPEVVLSEVSVKMDRAVDAFKRDLTQLRTGRATPVPRWWRISKSITMDP